MDDSWGEGKRALKYKVVEEDDDDEEEEEEFEEEEEQEGSDDYGDDGRKKRVVMVTAAAAAGSNNNNNNNVCISSKRTTCSSSSKGAGAGGGSSSSSSSCCQVDSCNADLRNAKQYHRRHKVCEYHAKASSVLISHLQQRFCQQCSRFHELGEFDESKRSCRRRLAGHNERRRKNAADYHG